MVSSGNEKKVKEFAKRFIEVCGTRHPTKIAGTLNISYQAAKNYLDGRLPDSKTLLKISDKTPYSIHWLLTGRGEKFVGQTYDSKLDHFLENLKAEDSSDFLPKFGIFLDEFMKNRHTSIYSPKTVILTPDKIRKEKVKEKENDPSKPSK